jgi:hypothetical protein
VWQTTFFVGAALGFTLEGLALRLDLGSSEGDAAVLGAWWLPFAVSAFGCVGLGLLMAVGERWLKMPFQLEEPETPATVRGDSREGSPRLPEKTRGGSLRTLLRESCDLSRRLASGRKTSLFFRIDGGSLRLLF